MTTNNDSLDVPPKEKQDIITALEKLSERLRHGKSIGIRIAACYKVALNMEKSYLVI
jgi:hypothetical protein